MYFKRIYENQLRILDELTAISRRLDELQNRAPATSGGNAQRKNGHRNHGRPAGRGNTPSGMNDKALERHYLNKYDI